MSSPVWDRRRASQRKRLRARRDARADQLILYYGAWGYTWVWKVAS